MAEDASVRPIWAFCYPSQQPRRLEWTRTTEQFFFLEDSQMVTQHLAFSAQQHSCRSASQSYKLTPVFNKSLKSCVSWSFNPNTAGLLEKNRGHINTGGLGEDLHFLEKNNLSCEVQTVRVYHYSEEAVSNFRLPIGFKRSFKKLKAELPKIYTAAEQCHRSRD